MTYKFEFFFSYMIMFFMVYYIGLFIFYTKLTNWAQKFKKFRLDKTRGSKLNCNWNSIFTLN